MIQDIARYHCPRCGEYLLELGVSSYLQNVSFELRRSLAAATRNSWEGKKALHITASTWKDFALPYYEMSVSKKVDNALNLIARKAQRPGEGFDIDVDQDYSLFCCADANEFREYLKHLQAQSLIFANQKGYAPTIEGWQLIEPRSRIGGEPDRCFVAMWFADELNDAWELGIAPAIRDSGFHPYRQKENPTNGAVIDRIFSEIRRSHFVVADFTGQRQSVYYEVGFASGLGRSVVSSCKEGEAQNLAFDTRHLGHIVWKDPKDLREKLTNSIKANIIPKG